MRSSIHRPVQALSLLIMFGIAAAAFAQDPGNPIPDSQSPSENMLGSQKPGSLLVYNIYSSNPSNLVVENVEISLTNTHATSPVFVHLFLVDGISGQALNGFIRLQPSQTASFLASHADPGVSGFIVAAAVNEIGCPISFNHLVGSANVKLTGGYQANLNAVAIAALSDPPTACGEGALPGTPFSLLFNGLNYNRLPRALALHNIRSAQDANSTLLIVNRIGGNLATNTSTIGMLSGNLFDDAGVAVNFILPASGPQRRAALGDTFPATVPTFSQLIPAGRTGWMKLFHVTSDFGYLGAAINFNPNAGANPASFNGGYNLQALSLVNSASLLIPAIPPVTAIDGQINLAADLAISGATGPPGLVRIGENLTYTINVRNNGFSRARLARLNYLLPAGVSPASATFTQGTSPAVRPCSLSGGMIVCNFSPMAFGETAAVTIVVQPAISNPALTSDFTVTTANRPSDPDLNNNSASITSMVGPFETSTTVSGSPGFAASGQVVTLTATVEAVSPGLGTPTGTVQFFDAGAPLGWPVALNGGSASINVAFVTTLSHIITAIYNGNADFTGSQSAPFVQGVSISVPTLSSTLTYDDGTTAPALAAEAVIEGKTIHALLPNPIGGAASITLAPINAASYPVPAGFHLPAGSLGYEISAPSGSYNTNNGATPIRLIFTIPDDNGEAWTEAEFNSLTIIHIRNGVPQPLITAHNFNDRQISAATDSLSPFIIARWLSAPLVVSPLSVTPQGPIQAQSSIIASAIVSGPDGASVAATWFWGDGSKTEVAQFGLAGGSSALSAIHSYAAPGIYTVRLKVIDLRPPGSVHESYYRYVVVYDPDGGFVTGGGWIDSPAGAYESDPSLTGKANFGFNSRYHKGASIPSGNTEFSFKAGGFNFRSTAYEWLLVAGHKAQYGGSGQVNGAGDYRFLLTAIDGNRPNGGGVDKLRIKIWDPATGKVLYDNRRGMTDEIDGADPQAIGGGSIVIHRADK